ncbi:MAG: PAS domain S-box protein [Chloroflexota bacterium]
MKILVADDERILLATTRRALESAGFETFGAQDGEEALQLTRAHRPDLVVLDVTMPKMDGFEVCHRIKTDPDLAGIFVLILSSTRIDSDSQVEGLESGADGYITRPVTDREMIARIQSLLRLKASEDTLRQSEENYRQLFEAGSDAIFLIDNKSGQILQANQAACDLYGYSRDELLALKNTDLSAEPEQTRQVTGSTAPIIEQVVTIPLRWHRKKDSTRFPVEITARFFIQAGRAVHIAAIRDISARIKTEDALKELTRFHQDIIKNMGEGIVVEDTEGKISFANPAAAAMLGYTEKELIGMRSTAIIPPDQQPILRAANQLREEGRSSRYEIDLVRKDGKRITILVSGSPRSEDKVYAGSLAVFTEITTRKQADESLHRQNEFLAALQETTLELLSQLDLDTLLENIVKRAGQLMRTNSGYLDLIEPETGELIPRVGFGALAESIDHQVHLGEGIAGIVWQTGKPLIVNDYDRWPGRISNYTPGTLYSVIGVPLFSAERILGVLGLGHESGSNQTFSEEDLSILTQFARLATIAIENARLFSTAQMELAERTQAEGALRASEERYRQISELISDYAYAYNIESDGSLTMAWLAGGFEHTTGFTEQEYEQRGGVLGMIHPEDLPIASARAERLLSRQDHSSEFRILRKDGEVRWLRDHAHPVWDETQGRVTRIHGAAQDITAQKQARILQDALFWITQAADQSVNMDEFYKNIHTIIQTVMIADNFYIALYDRENDLLTFPYSVDHYDIDASPIPPGKGLTAYVLRTGRSLLCDFPLHEELLRSGEIETIGASAKIWLGAPLIVENEIIGAVVIQDYTNPRAYTEREQRLLEFVSSQIAVSILRKRSEDSIKSYSEKLEMEVQQRSRELHEAQEKLVRQEKLAILGQLSGSVGHELRNPLGVMANAVYLLKLIQPDANEMVIEYLSILEAEIHTSDKIITDLLEFSRTKSVDREPTPAADLIKRVLERYPAPEGITVSLKVPASLPPLFVDPGHIEQVFGNLVVNACQAMPNGGRLSLSARRQKDMLAIAVSDTGTGISPENMARLFEPLFTTKTKGIGLGLAVCRKLVEANMGRIETRSEPGEGTTFTVSLPVKNNPQESPERV